MQKTTDAKSIRRRLGRGLGGLISAPVAIDLPPRTEAPQAPADRLAEPPARGLAASPQPAAAGPSDAGLLNLALSAIKPSPHQPRTTFDERALDALAASIRSAGVMQPIVVRPLGEGAYELVAGERRWRAAKRAGLESIPAVVRPAGDRQSAEWSLIENLQREDLDPIERGSAFRRLVEEFGLRHQDIAELVGLDRSSVTNHLRLLELDEDLRDLVRQGMLGAGHARALLALTNIDERRRLAARAVREEWSVRAVEREVRKRTDGEGAAAQAHAPEPATALATITPKRAHLADLERRLSDHLATKVFIRPGKKRGSGAIVIEFYDSGQFEGLMSRFGFSID